MPNPFKRISYRQNEIEKIQNFVLNLYILMQTTFKPKRILNSNNERKALLNDI